MHSNNRYRMFPTATQASKAPLIPEGSASASDKMSTSPDVIAPPGGLVIEAPIPGIPSAHPMERFTQVRHYPVQATKDATSESSSSSKVDIPSVVTSALPKATAPSQILAIAEGNKPVETNVPVPVRIIMPTQPVPNRNLVPVNPVQHFVQTRRSEHATAPAPASHMRVMPRKSVSIGSSAQKPYKLPNYSAKDPIENKALVSTQATRMIQVPIPVIPKRVELTVRGKHRKHFLWSEAHIAKANSTPLLQSWDYETPRRPCNDDSTVIELLALRSRIALMKVEARIARDAEEGVVRINVGLP